MQYKIFICLTLSILFASCVEKNAKEHSKIQKFIQDDKLLKCEFGKSIESEYFSPYKNYKYLYLIEDDLDGDGKIDVISVRADSVFFVDDRFQEEENIPAVLVVNQQFIPFVLKVNAIQGGFRNNVYDACELIIVDVDKNDSYKEIFLKLGQYGEDPPYLRYFARYTNQLLTLTKIEGKEINFQNSNFIKLSYSKNIGFIGDSVEKKVYSEQLELYTVGFNISKIDSSEIYTTLSAACPYIYTMLDGVLVFKGEIIRNIIGEEAEATQILELGNFKKGKHQIRISEEKDEISYINMIEFFANDKLVEYSLDVSIKRLIEHDDTDYLILHKGNTIDIEIDLLCDTDNLIINAKGYYIPNAKKYF